MSLKPEHMQFIDKFIELRNHREAAKASGYSPDNGLRLFRKLRKHIEERIQDELLMQSVKAVGVTKDTMGEGATVFKQDLRHKAAMDVLDRAGFGKQQTVDLNATPIQAVITLPMKVAVGQHNEVSEATDEEPEVEPVCS